MLNNKFHYSIASKSILDKLYIIHKILYLEKFLEKYYYYDYPNSYCKKKARKICKKYLRDISWKNKEKIFRMIEDPPEYWLDFWIECKVIASSEI